MVAHFDFYDLAPPLPEQWAIAEVLSKIQAAVEVRGEDCRHAKRTKGRDHGRAVP